METKDKSETKKIFFSWQSDTPSNTNRGFIRDILEEACGVIASDANIAEASRDLSIDSDTQGVAGQPPIVDTIFKKIDSSAVFVADMTFTSKRSDGRPTPNPNVLIEYGWALKSLRYGRVICVMNEHFGKASSESLPFDLSHLRWPIRYSLQEKDSKEVRKKEHDKLLAIIVESLRASLATVEVKEPRPGIKDSIKTLMSDPGAVIKLDDYMGEHLQSYLNNINIENFSTANTPSNEPTKEAVIERISKYDSFTNDLGLILAIFTKWAKPEQFYLLERAFIKISEADKRSSSGSDYYMWMELGWYPILRLLYFVGISAVIHERYDILRVLSEISVHDYNGGKQLNLISHICASVNSRVGESAFKMLPEKENKLVPRSEHLFENLKKIISESFLLDEKEYERYFDKFEIFLALICADYDQGWGLVGRFGYKERFGSSPFKMVVEEAKREAKNWKPVKAGLFRGSPERFLEVVESFELLLEKVSLHWS